MYNEQSDDGAMTTHKFYNPAGEELLSLSASNATAGPHTFVNETPPHFKATPERTIEFYNEAGEMIGCFDFSGEVTSFVGNADEGATIFIAALAASENLLFKGATQ